MKKVAFIFLTILLISCNPSKYNDLKDGLYAELQTNKGDILLELFNILSTKGKGMIC